MFISFLGNAQTQEYVYKSSDAGRPPKVNIVVEAKYNLLYGKDSVVVMVTLLYQTGFEKVKNESELKVLYDVTQQGTGSQIFLDTARVPLFPKGKNTMVFVLKFPYMEIESAQLQVESLEWDKTNEMTLTIPVSLQKKTIASGYQLFSIHSQVPLQSTYCAVKDSLKLQQDGKFRNKLAAKFYPASFAKAAALPYIDTPEEFVSLQVAEKTFYLDSVFTFDNPGIYSLYIEGDKSTPFQIFAGNGKYPQVTKVNDLAGPLVYIANETEWLHLSYNKVTKDTLDNFWQRYAGNKETARRIIKLFYQRVVQANEYYTEYKDGWKTDRGMVYIIMGRPERISQNGDDESWYYKMNNYKAEFKFTRLKDKNKGVYYRLTRSADLEKAWQENLEKWRKGAIE